MLRQLSVGSAMLGALVVLGFSALLATPAGADDTRANMGHVPELSGFKLADANHALRRRGLKLGSVFEISRERMYADVLKNGWPRGTYPDAADYVRAFRVGSVYRHAPSVGTKLALGSEVAVVVVASRDGRLPDVLKALTPKAIPKPGAAAPGRTSPSRPPLPQNRTPRRGEPTNRGMRPAQPGGVPPRPAPPTQVPQRGRDGDVRVPEPGGAAGGTPPRPAPPVAVPPRGTGPLEGATPRAPVPQPSPGTGAEQPNPTGAAPRDPLAPPSEAGSSADTASSGPYVRERSPASVWDMRSDLPVADGSPDAPRPAPAANRDVVPPLVGLDLNDADLLARRNEMTLYVERVAGHPVGRVLKQWPAAASARPQGGVIKVSVTAGGDFEAATPAAAEVYVREVEVPDLLDRTVPQATRILGAVGLRLERRERTGGLPGLVADQKPIAGGTAYKGGVVVVFVAPGKIEHGELGPASRRPTDQEPVARSVPKAPKGTPQPIAPAPGTRMPREATLTLGFSWKPIEGATAYIVEVQESTAGGTWAASERRTARTTVLAAELVRLDTRAVQTLRWRVRAVKDGAQGEPSAWINLPAEPSDAE